MLVVDEEEFLWTPVSSQSCKIVSLQRHLHQKEYKHKALEQSLLITLKDW